MTTAGKRSDAGSAENLSPSPSACSPCKATTRRMHVPLPVPARVRCWCASPRSCRSRRPGDARRRIHHHAQVSEKNGSLKRSANLSSTTPCFATCAGCILLAREVLHPRQRSLGVLDATVERNAYGRQIDSTILTLPTELPAGHWKWFSSARHSSPGWAPSVQILAQRDGFPTLVRQGTCSWPPSIPR